ncbi:MAG: choice-of-anchor X domain-containing protein, partial [Planctomycetota bacterium]
MRPTLLLFCWIAVLIVPAACTKEDDDPQNQPPVMVNATASPDPVARGASCLITVDVSDPDGSVASVVGDLTPFGGAPGEAWYDDGTNGDTFPSDGTWTLRAPVATTATPGPASIVLTATDDLGATSSGPVPVTIKTNLVPVLSNPLATPALAKPGALMLFSVGASDDGSIASVVVDLVTPGGSSTQAMVDDGTQGDATASDGTYSFEYTIPSGQNLGNRTLPVTAVDDQGDSASTA